MRQFLWPSAKGTKDSAVAVECVGFSRRGGLSEDIREIRHLLPSVWELSSLPPSCCSQQQRTVLPPHEGSPSMYVTAEEGVILTLCIKQHTFCHTE